MGTQTPTNFNEVSRGVTKYAQANGRLRSITIVNARTEVVFVTGILSNPQKHFVLYQFLKVTLYLGKT
ncbi:hypothetical protein CYANOKiyG1_47410 [Okeania sp. KiyG1]|nr:hypothetical protein CYANOKiyG1_47410 [Okeania sp. KiyG1]